MLKINPDIQLMCELHITVKAYRAECTWSDANSHFFVNPRNSWLWSLFYISTTAQTLEDRMTRQNNVDFLQNELPKQVEYVPLVTRIAMYFQHHGAPYHYTRHVMRHLNDTFPNRWIGRGSTINWPPRSPDLTPLDFCLWGLMKSEVCRKKSGYTRRTAR